MPDAIVNLRIAYQTLKRNVSRTLQTQRGAEQQLNHQVNEVLQYFAAAELHRDAFPIEEWTTLEHSGTAMIEALNAARHQSSDPPESTSIPLTTRTSTGGRPRIDIQPNILAESLSLRPLTQLSSVFNVSARTIRRRALNYGLRQPASAPAFVETSRPDGSVRRTRTHASTSNPPVARTVPVLTDEQLDREVSTILEIFPDFGRRMIIGHLRAAGHNIPRARIAASYLRVHGSPGSFGIRAIHRTPYHVAGANSLWHHDGQHGLIRYKMVIHCFIDGKSRFVTGVRVSNNNRSETVLELFDTAVRTHGLPRRVRGDHGTENVLVALAMDLLRGEGHYIYGRSVNNTRIERLWYDVTHGFGHKWKLFFVDLELNHGLMPTFAPHIWLIHHLFLNAINDDAQDWAEAWNRHQLGQRGQRGRSPRDMFFFSLLEDGPRGIEGADEPAEPEIGDPAAYGIDWEAAEDPQLMQHLLLENPQDWDEANPFAAGAPENLSHVPCDPPPAPFSAEQIAHLDSHLAQAVDTTSRSMNVRKLVWQEAFRLCNEIYIL